MKKNKITVLTGNGKIVARKTSEVTTPEGKKSHTAENIIIATGARSKELPNIKIDGKKIIGYREVLNLPVQPKSMVVIGAGANWGRVPLTSPYPWNKSCGCWTTEQGLVPREDADISKNWRKSSRRWLI